MTGSILMLTADRLIDRRILNSATSLRTAGWDVTIVAAPLAGDRVVEPGTIRIPAMAKHALKESVVAGAYAWLLRQIGHNGRLVQWLRQKVWQYAVDHETYHERRYWPTVEGMTATVIVANDLPMLPVAARLAASCNARLVYDSHELYSEQDFSARERRTWQDVERKFIGRCDAVITVNQSIAAELGRRYALSGVQVILNAERCAGLPQPSRYWHELYGLHPDSLVLLFQGGLSADRNLDQLVLSMDGDDHPDLHLVILGDGETSRPLHRLVRRYGLGTRVHLHPAVPQGRLLTLTAAADAGIIPYRDTCLNHRYCSPNKLFEFIAAGVPILASDLPELRRFVVDLDIGMVGDLGTARDIRAGISDFFADRTRLTRWRQNIERVRRQVCWEAEEKKLLAIYEPLR